MASQLYKPLLDKQFRLLRISPSLIDNSGRPKLTLETHSLEDVARRNYPLVYDALSYVWGRESANSPTWSVTPAEEPAQSFELVIRPNLHDFLTAVAGHGGEDTLIFADRICINQDDTKEREQQVAQMDEIYAGSRRVCCWLGARDDEGLTGDYLRFVNSVAKHPAESPDNLAGMLRRLGRGGWGKLSRELATGTVGEETDGSHDLRVEIARVVRAWLGDLEHVTKCLVHVLRKDWFTRMWIVQEACLGPNPIFLCGIGGGDDDNARARQASLGAFDDSLLFLSLWTTYFTRFVKRDFRGLSRSMHTLLGESMLARANFDDLAGVRRATQRQRTEKIGGRYSLLELVARYSTGDRERMGATDDRDRVFALVGLARRECESDEKHRAWKASLISYEEELDVAYTRFATYAIQQDVDLLTFVQPHLGKSAAGFPSWVPDWSVPRAVPRGWYDLKTPAFTAGGAPTAGAAPTVSSSADPLSTTVLIKGVVVGRIERVGCESIKFVEEDLAWRDSWALYLVQRLARSGGVAEKQKLLDLHSAVKFLAEARQFLSLAANGQVELLALNRPAGPACVPILDGATAMQEYSMAVADVEQVHQPCFPVDLASADEDGRNRAQKLDAMGRYQTYLRLATGGMAIRAEEAIDYEELREAHDSLVTDWWTLHRATEILAAWGRMQHRIAASISNRIAPLVPFLVSSGFPGAGRWLQSIVRTGSTRFFTFAFSASQLFSSILLLLWSPNRAVSRNGLSKSPATRRTDSIASEASFQSLLKRNARRNLFATDTGHVGLADEQLVVDSNGRAVYESVKAGDVVVVLRGSRVPHVLRETVGTTSDGSGAIETKQERCYKYLGDAYCDGVMHGEAVKSVRDDVFDKFYIQH